MVLDDQDDIAPAAMEEEIYDHTPPRGAIQRKQLPEQEVTSGCWYKFKSGVRGKHTYFVLKLQNCYRNNLSKV